MTLKINNPKISIVVPVYNEKENVKELYGKIKGVFSESCSSYEIIFVDDGSKDETLKILKEICRTDDKIKIAKLARNFGQPYAFLAGFQYTKGKIVITMDGDLQNDPQDIPKLLERINQGFDIVSGWRYKRRDLWIRRLCSVVANWLMSRRTDIRLHDYGCAFCAIKRELTDRLKEYGKNVRFIKPLLVSLASSVGEVEVRHHSRKRGASKYSLFKIIITGLDFMVNFSTKPKKTHKPIYIIEEIIEKNDEIIYS